MGLCDQVLGEVGLRQHRFDWLRGDPGANGVGQTLPVDGYWPGHNLVVEYWEIQHDQPVKVFDRRMTVSGVDRGTQRKIYDDRKAVQLAEHGIDLVIVRARDLSMAARKLRRHAARDEQVLRALLDRWVS